MGKTLGRDIQVLLKILAYIEKMQNTLKNIIAGLQWSL